MSIVIDLDRLAARTPPPPALRQVTVAVERVGGINLGQGVCNLPPPQILVDHAHDAARAGINRYTNPRGLQSLRSALAEKLRRHNGITADPDRHVLATCGATGAFEAVCGVLLDPGDEVIVFEPTYPYHMQALRRYGANMKIVPLAPPNWSIDFDEVKKLLTSKTKFILINTPGNPSGKVVTRGELETLSNLLDGTNVLLVTDEIYEYMTFDGRTHLSPASVPSLESRTITIGGYSKTFAITGWRIGYLVVPDSLSDAMTSFIDAVYVCPPAPLQQAAALTIAELPDSFYADLQAKYQHKRDRFAAGLEQIGLEPIRPDGAYYMICGFEKRHPNVNSTDFVMRMIHESGVGAVPSTDFVRDHANAKWVRFCLAQEDAILDEAIERLGRFEA